MTARPEPLPPEFVAFAHTLADSAGKAILPHFRKTIAVDNKADAASFDPVTAADRNAELEMARLIAESFPDHGLIGEEFGTRGAGARYRWVLDPIDGTRAFIMGWPMWGTLIGLLDGETPILGMMDQPFTEERFWFDGQATRFRRAGGTASQIATRKCPQLADAILATTHPDLFADGAERDGFDRIKGKARMTRYGGDCYSYCLVAAGFVDLVVEAGLKPHDVVALIPIIEGAGGRMTTWDGKPAASGGCIVAAGDPALHEAALRVLAG